MDSTPHRRIKVTPTIATSSSTSVVGNRVKFPVLCCHRDLAKYSEVRCGVNKGRRYYGCKMYPVEGYCKFFLWEEDLLAFVQEEQSTADSTFSTELEAEKIARLKAKCRVVIEESKKHKMRADQLASNARKAYIALFISWLFFIFYKQLI